MQEHLALVQRLADEFVLLIIELHNCLLEVSHAPVDELSRFRGRPCVENVMESKEMRKGGRRTGGKIVSLYEGNFQTACNRIKSDARARRAASDDE